MTRGIDYLREGLEKKGFEYRTHPRLGYSIYFKENGLLTSGGRIEIKLVSGGYGIQLQRLPSMLGRFVQKQEPQTLTGELDWDGKPRDEPARKIVDYLGLEGLVT